LAATTLRNVLGTKNLAEILSEREIISQVMQNSLDEATDPWGVKVHTQSISDDDGNSLLSSFEAILIKLFSLCFQAERVEM
jgi:regulator of protease activity HflC (stomatin/prohibitin superfamily)